MKKSCLGFLMIFFTASLSPAQDYDWETADSLWQLQWHIADSLDALRDVKTLQFETVNTDPNNGKTFITAYTCSVYKNTLIKIKVEYPWYADDPHWIAYNEENYYIIEGKLREFSESEDFCQLDTVYTVKNYIPKRLSTIPWTLNVSLYNDRLVHTMSNGHGKTEKDDFSAGPYALDLFAERLKEIKKKYPKLK